MTRGAGQVTACPDRITPVCLEICSSALTREGEGHQTVTMTFCVIGGILKKYICNFKDSKEKSSFSAKATSYSTSSCCNV